MLYKDTEDAQSSWTLYEINLDFLGIYTHSSRLSRHQIHVRLRSFGVKWESVKTHFHNVLLHR